MENGDDDTPAKRKLDGDDNAAATTTPTKKPKPAIDNNSNRSNEPYSRDKKMFSGLLRTLLDLGVHRPVCVLRKKLSGSDVSLEEHRLLLPKKMMKEKLLELLTPEERERVDNEVGVEVAVMDRGCERYEMKLKYLMNGKESYRIIGKGWARFVAANRLEAGETLDVWGFRLAGEGGGEGKVHLVFLVYDDEDERNEQGEEEAFVEVGDENGVELDPLRDWIVRL